jgi:hypothetical protein
MGIGVRRRSNLFGRISWPTTSLVNLEPISLKAAATVGALHQLLLRRLPRGFVHGVHVDFAIVSKNLRLVGLDGHRPFQVFRHIIVLSFPLFQALWLMDVY